MSTPLPPALRRIDDLTGDGLARALSGPLDVPQLLAHARFDPDRYHRVAVHRTEAFEVRLLCWNPGQSSALHGHGASACAFRVLEGTATEFRLDGAVTRLQEGEVAVAQTEHIHQVGNLGDTPLVTLHIYAPPLPVDQPSATDGRPIVVIGGGLSGAALVWQLLRRGDPDLRVTWVEPGPHLGHGQIGATRDPSHRLNVPANRMSLDPSDPDDFLRWVRAEAPETEDEALLPRPLFARYVDARLAEAVQASRVKLRLARATATDVRRADGGWEVTLDDGRTLRADAVALATGNGPTRLPEALQWIRDDPRLIADPWSPGALDFPPTDRVFVVGTGLTATDVLLTLHHRAQAGPIVALSRGGRWPRPHLPEVAWRGHFPLDVEAAPRTADGLAAWFQAALDRAAAEGVPWQAVAGAVREHVATLWASLPEREQGRWLLRHRPGWEVLRHRTPAETASLRHAWEARGWLQTVRGHLTAALRRPDDLVLEVETERGTEAIAVDRVIVATGAESDPALFGSPLWDRLLSTGTAARCPHGLGVRTDPHGLVIRADGVPQAGLHALGGLVRPARFEITSLPDIRAQVAAVADRILVGA